MKQSMPRRNKYDILKSEFVISNTDINLCPDDGKPEYAFIGRSNVGKSSLINMLCGRKKLAMTSARPGKTMLINHFLINDSWYIVDLPAMAMHGEAKPTETNSEALYRNMLTADRLSHAFLFLSIRALRRKK